MCHAHSATLQADATTHTFVLLNTTTSYDYIIAGAGCAGLSLAMHLIHSGQFKDKAILIVDQHAKNSNDRTWCFWEKGEGLFEPIVHKQWEQLLFHSEKLSKPLNIRPYSYKLIRGIDFYVHCLSRIQSCSNFTYLQAPIDKIVHDENRVGVQVDGRLIRSQFVFNSILFNKPQLSAKQCWLLQHFKGWFIKTAEPAFDPAVGTLMDFRTSQDHGATFFYVLPFSTHEALVEYTLFSPTLLEDQAYEDALQQYIGKQLNISNYSILEKEFGIIPMTNYSFPSKEGSIMNIGTAGGQTKGSSGYTFQFIQKRSKAIVESLLQHGHPFKVHNDSRRFHFYDSVLLHILNKRSLRGADIFTDLFKKNKASEVFAFLDNETSLTDELKIISTLPTLPFTKAAIQQLSF